MAKLEGRLHGDFGQILEEIDQLVMKSVSASLEEKSDFAVKDCLCAVRVYERYSFSGGNRLSLSITLLKVGEAVYLSAITAGGFFGRFKADHDQIWRAAGKLSEAPRGDKG